MKKSYIKLLILEISFIITILFNNFGINKLNNYEILGYLLAMIIILKIILGFEKQKYRYIKDIILSVIIYLIIFLLINYCLGVFVSFTMSPNYWNVDGLIHFIIPTLLNIFLVEFLRNGLIKKSGNSKLLICMSAVLFIIVDLLIVFNNYDLSTPYNKLIFIAYFLLPSISKNVLCTFMSFKVGYKPSIIYRIISECYMYVIPIYPDFGDYINCMFRGMMPSILLLYFFKHLREDIRNEVESLKNKTLLNIFYILLLIITAVSLYLTSGMFKYYSMAVGSNSMIPAIYKGDMTIVKKLTDKEKDDLKKGDILVYKYKDTVFVHRIVDIYTDNKGKTFYTKGDANNSIDNFPINYTMVIGKVKYKIPLIGYPTVIVNEKTK